MKECRVCNQKLPYSEFNKDKYEKDGHKTSCRECDRWIRARNRYGIDEKTWEHFNSDEAHCEICSTAYDLCIDHNHNTGEFRGILCRACNRGVGMLKDNSKLVFSAYNYLKENKC